MRLPAELLPETEPAEPVNSTPGAGIAAEDLPLQPITMPITMPVVLPVGVAPPPAAGGAGAPRLAPPEQAPGSVRADPRAGRQPQLDIGSNVNVPPASYRVGYNEYLRTAGLSQVMALAGPGLAGIIVLTGAGGLVGYRQAKAGHALRTSRTARFVN
jgi:hypothetical protein